MNSRASAAWSVLLVVSASALAQQPEVGGDSGEVEDVGMVAEMAVADRSDASLFAQLTTRSNFEFRSFTAYWDNDGTYPNLINDTDRFYTSGQGIEFGFGFTPEDPSDFAKGWEEPRFGVGFWVKQHMYTASDIEIADPDPDDHPYAGWLTLGAAFQRADEHRHDHVGLEIGVVGSWSFAEDIQKWVHDTWPDEIDPEGWDTQLANELAVNVTYQRTWRTDRADLGGLQMDMLPAVRFDGGNVFIRARGQTTLRLGWNMPDDFGPASFLGIKDHTGGGIEDPNNPWSVYGYATVAADAVGRNMFIDGNTFANSRSAEREDLVSRATLGVMARYKCVEFGWAQTWETETFEAQPNGQTWGSFVLNVQCRF